MTNPYNFAFLCLSFIAVRIAGAEERPVEVPKPAAKPAPPVMSSGDVCSLGVGYYQDQIADLRKRISEDEAKIAELTSQVATDSKQRAFAAICISAGINPNTCNIDPKTGIISDTKGK